MEKYVTFRNAAFRSLCSNTAIFVSKGPCKRTQHCWPTTRSIVGPNMLRRLHGTTTMLALVGTRCEQFEPFTLLGPCKRTQHCWPKPPNNTQQCCDLLCPFAWALQARSQDFSWGGGGGGWSLRVEIGDTHL